MAEGRVTLAQQWRAMDKKPRGVVGLLD